MKATPGPWQLRMTNVDSYSAEEHTVEVERYIRDADGLVLARIAGGPLPPAAADVHLPNARLIAAAPLLLRVVESVATNPCDCEPECLYACESCAAREALRAADRGGE